MTGTLPGPEAGGLLKHPWVSTNGIPCNPALCGVLPKSHNFRPARASRRVLTRRCLDGLEL